MTPRGNIVGQRVDVLENDVDDGATAPTRITPKRALHVTLYSADGTEITSFGGVDPVGLKNIAEDTINPATEDKQDDIITTLGDHTTELSGISDVLASIDSHADTIEGYQSNISGYLGDIDGCVSGTELQVDIVGGLPAGTNTIGIVNVQGAASGGWFEPYSTDFDTGIGVDTVSSFGIVVPGNGAPAVIQGDATYGLDVDITRSALPTGASTSANQDTTNTYLSNIQVAVQVMDDWDDGSDHCRVVGSVAHDAADGGNPTKIGYKARDGLADTTLVAEGDRCDGISDVDGAQIVRADSPLGDTIIERLTDTSGTSTAFSNFGAVASTRNVITAYSVFNSSATAGYLDIRDGTAGTVLWTIPLPAGGGANLSGLRIRSTANTALAYDVSAALSTVYISVQGYRTKC